MLFMFSKYPQGLGGGERGREEKQTKKCYRSDFEKGLVSLNRNPGESELGPSRGMLAVRSPSANLFK